MHRTAAGVIVAVMSKDRIRIVIAGCAGGRGSWFTSQAASHPDFSIVGLVDRLPDAAAVVAAELGLKRAAIHRSTEEALGATACDAVLVATPDAEHAAAAIPALEAGKHVYVEKPLATTMEDCLRMAAVDDRAGGKTMVGFNLRFAPFYRRMRDLSRDGHVGRMLTIQADEFYYGGRTYFRRWNRLRSVGGGLWVTKACHDFDILSWIAGEPPTRVSAQASLTHYVARPDAATRCSRCPIERKCPDSALPHLEKQPEFWGKIHDIREASGHWPPRDLCLYNSDKDTFDHGIAQVTFGEDIASVYTLNVVAAFTDRSLTVAGTDGTIRGSLASPDIQYWRRHCEGERPEIIPVIESGKAAAAGHGGGDARLLHEFAAFVRGEPSVAVSPPEASVAVAMGLAATASSDSGSVVAMADLKGWTELEALL